MKLNDDLLLGGNDMELVDNIRGRSIYTKVIPTVCNLKNMLEKCETIDWNFYELKPWEKRSYKAYRIDEIESKLRVSTVNEKIEVIRNHILSNAPFDMGASVIDIYLVAYVAETFTPGKDTFFKFIYDNKISDKPNSAQAIWQVGNGDGVFLKVLNIDGTVKDSEFMRLWIQG